MQKLMETYFMYNINASYKSNELLFSEKHLCNETDLRSQFFNKICTHEAQNLNTRLLTTDNSDEKEMLTLAKNALEDRQARVSKIKKDFIEYPEDLLCFNEAMLQLAGSYGIEEYYNFNYNCSDEEIYKLLTSKLGIIKLTLMEQFELFDFDLVQNIYGLHFVRKDSKKLNNQKRQLLQQVNSGFQVDYSVDNIQKVLRKIV